MPEEKMTYTEAWQEAKVELKTIRQSQGRTNERLASIDQHLKNLNGTVARHETKLTELDGDMVLLKVGAKGAEVERKTNKSFNERLISNWDKIVFGALLSAIAAKLFGIGG